MSIKDRLKTAYENVALNGDKTWIDTCNSFQRANQQLYSKEYQLNNIKIIEERPRTVKDSIPNSKLAKYADYEYNEARELCYTRCIQKTNLEYLSRQTENQMVQEPWVLPEVDDLFIWFLYCQNHYRSDLGPFELLQEGINRVFNVQVYDMNVESPLLSTYGFQEKKLKMHITSDKIKAIWKAHRDNSYQRCMVIIKDRNLNVHKFPSSNFLLSENIDLHNQFLDEVSDATADFDHLKNLAKSFKEQNAWISKCTSKYTERLPTQSIEACEEASKIEPLSSRRLYSAVLQGLSPNDKASQKKTEVISAARYGYVTEQEKSEMVSLPVTNFATCTTAISTVTVLNSKGQQYSSEGNDISTQCKKVMLKQDLMKVQKNTTLQTNSKIITKSKSSEVPISSKIFTTSREYNSHTEETNMRSLTPIGCPFISPPMSHNYVNNYNYQFNTHYSNTFQNSCGCTNTFSSHTSQVITNRNLQTFQRQTPFMPSQYQYAQPVLMLQQNRTSTVYPLSTPVQQSYFYQPVQQPRVMQRWIVPQNYTRTNVTQQNYPSSVQSQFVPQPPAHWINSNQPLASTSQHYSDIQTNRTKSKHKKVTPPQISILKNKGRKLHDESSISTETTDSDILRRSNCTHSTSSVGLEVSSFPPQVKKDFTLPIISKTIKSDCDEVVSKTVNLLFDDESHVPVASTLSEELEIQALEQYCNSTDSVYQELERQAAEQYDGFSENLKSPPRLDVYIGGLTCNFRCSIF